MKRFLVDHAPKIFIGLAALAAIGIAVFALRRMPSAEMTRPETASPFSEQKKAEPVIPPEGIITLRDETFSRAYDELYDKRENYYGREIEFSGYVMHEAALTKGGFLIGRELLWCCATDVYFIGFAAYTDGDIPKDGALMYVSGILEKSEYTNPDTNKSFPVPAIRVQVLRPDSGVPLRVIP